MFWIAPLALRKTAARGGVNCHNQNLILVKIFQDSDVAVEKKVKKQTKMELKKALALSREDQASLTKKIADQKAKNEKKLQELSEA